MGTPLHSQNFVMIDEGVLTNNRRIVTKTMWYNGTELSALARRALEHEQVTYVAHNSGWIHVMYPEASIDRQQYHHFREKLGKFLEIRVDYEIFMNFLRDYSRYQKLFQYCFRCQGADRYIRLEKAFGYEHGSKNRLSDKNNRKLFCEMDEEDLCIRPIDHRFRIDPDSGMWNPMPYAGFLEALKNHWPGLMSNEDFFHDLKKFVHTVPRLPSENKTYEATLPIHIDPGMTREEIIAYLHDLRRPYPASRVPRPFIIADLAFYAGRYMDSCDWRPFFKAAFERNPVTLDYFREMDLADIYLKLAEFPDESIYDASRLALPDEVVNYRRGDGLEKAITLVHVAKSRRLEVLLEQSPGRVTVRHGKEKFCFTTTKNLQVPGDFHYL
jgi:hypothetical protein